MIYADNAATTKMDEDAYEAIKPFLSEKYANASQPYFFSKPAKDALKTARTTIAKCIGAEPEEIIFTSGGTESDNWALKSVVYNHSNKKRIITSSIEHHAVLNSCRFLEKCNIPIDYLAVDNHGVVLPETLCNEIKDDTALVSVMMANNEIGTIEPIQELCNIAHKYGVLFHTDAVQAVGHIPVDVRFLGVDLLSASAHKFNGMKGSGFIYIRKGLNIQPYIDGGSQERGLRAGTENIAAAVAMAVALQKNCDRMESAQKQLNNLEYHFLKRLSQNGIDFIRNGSANHLPGIVNISLRNSDGELILHRLDLKGICVSTGSACDSNNTHISHVIQAIKVPALYAKGTIRISFGISNTIEDAIIIADSINDILTKQAC